jgi:hypothetical protein
MNGGLSTEDSSCVKQKTSAQTIYSGSNSVPDDVNVTLMRASMIILAVRDGGGVVIPTVILLLEIRMGVCINSLLWKVKPCPYWRQSVKPLLEGGPKLYLKATA